MPVPITLDYTAEATASDTIVWGDANVGLNGLYGESSYYVSNGLQSNAEAWAMGYASAFYDVDMCGIISTHQVNFWARYTVAGLTSDEGVRISSSLLGGYEPNPYEFPFGGEPTTGDTRGESNLDGTLTIGTSGGFAPGTGGLLLTVTAPGPPATPGNNLWWNRSIRIWSTDPMNPLDTMVDTESAALAVLAGQTLNIDLDNDIQMCGINFMHYYSNQITFVVSPEPATLSLLTVGCAALLRRRRQCGRR